MSKAKPAVRRPVVTAEDSGIDVPEAWRRRPWIPVLISVIVIAALVGSGLLIDEALKTPRPTALSACVTSTQLAPHQFIAPQPICITAAHTYQATINTTQGTVVIQLYPEIAPVTVNNFIVLALNGYYNGMLWRTDDLVAQSGDPIGDGTGGPGYNLPEEPNTTPAWEVGAVGMARPVGAPINGSQFFIERAAWDPAPKQIYNRFGTVIKGMDKAQLLTAPTDKIISITIQVG
ncbi:MAG TPA: peptidylprolyl isomerase [Candidatus Limnocylindria bacterium]|nr:peptidylprolyl isomerase [Candidatus Limnocylindria bacterium]